MLNVSVKKRLVQHHTAPITDKFYPTGAVPFQMLHQAFP